MIRNTNEHHREKVGGEKMDKPQKASWILLLILAGALLLAWALPTTGDHRGSPWTDGSVAWKGVAWRDVVSSGTAEDRGSPWTDGEDRGSPWTDGELVRA